MCREGKRKPRQKNSSLFTFSYPSTFRFIRNTQNCKSMAFFFLFLPALLPLSQLFRKSLTGNRQGKATPCKNVNESIKANKKIDRSLEQGLRVYKFEKKRRRCALMAERSSLSSSLTPSWKKRFPQLQPHDDDNGEKTWVRWWPFYRGKRYQYRRNQEEKRQRHMKYLPRYRLLSFFSWNVHFCYLLTFL